MGCSTRIWHSSGWIDDLLRQDALDWADERPYPTLLVHPESRAGLTHEHVEEIAPFVALLRSPRNWSHGSQHPGGRPLTEC